MVRFIPSQAYSVIYALVPPIAGKISIFIIFSRMKSGKKSARYRHKIPTFPIFKEKKIAPRPFHLVVRFVVGFIAVTCNAAVDSSEHFLAAGKVDHS